MSSPPPVTRSGAQRAAARELSKSIYQRSNEPLLVRAFHAIERWIDHRLASALDHAPAGNGGALAVVVIIAAVIGLVVWRVGVPRRARTEGAVLAGAATMRAADHRELAERAAEHADWRTAVIERMRAIARELEERGVLEPRAGRTATELAREAAALLPSTAAGLTRSAELFNTVTYGAGTANSEQAAELARTDDAIRAASRNKVLAQ
jgi:Domain of unknown function (DUF4129)